MPVALISGASGGIGQALCAGFRNSGYYVIATDLEESGANWDQFIKADLKQLCGDQAALNDFISKLKLQNNELRVLVNNAALQKLNSTEHVSYDEWLEVNQVNVAAPFFLTQALLPNLEKGNGSVINIGSVHAHATKSKFITYATSKSALNGLTRALAVDLGSRVRVNSINPAAVATPMLMEGFSGKEEKYELLASMHPVGRIGIPEDVAKLALFLASEEAAFITGTEMNMDGGVLSRLHDPD